MAGIRRVQVLSLVIGLLPAFTLAETIQKTPSVADCSFQIDPDRFLAAQGRVRREVNDRVVKMSRSARAAVSVTVAPQSLPQRNFIDQEIFDKLMEKNVPSAPLSSSG